MNDHGELVTDPVEIRKVLEAKKARLERARAGIDEEINYFDTKINELKSSKEFTDFRKKVWDSDILYQEGEYQAAYCKLWYAIHTYDKDNELQ